MQITATYPIILILLNFVYALVDFVFNGFKDTTPMLDVIGKML
jgi:hypothetical protein